MKIFLKDMNVNVVKAWKSEFSEEEDVIISHGDIFQDTEADVLVSPANSFGFMIGGIDGVYTRRFGKQLQDSLQAKLRKDFGGECPVGQAIFIKIDNDPDFKVLASAPTMRVPMDVLGSVNAYLAFRAVLRGMLHYQKANIEGFDSVLCPGLGTAVGNLDPKVCARQMKLAYDVVVKEKTLVYDSSFEASRNDSKLRGYI